MALVPMKFDIPHRGLEWLEYYPRHKAFHCGWDLNTGVGNEDLGDPIFNPVAGTVEYVSKKPSRANRYNGGFGWFVVVYHEEEGVWSKFAHMKSVSCHKGQKVDEGQQLGEVGNTGTRYAHLHWEVWKQSMYDRQKKHWRKFAYYPTRQPKQFVVDNYLDGLAWVDELSQKKDWKEEIERRLSILEAKY
jgi:murein DD-endopeptidase MepM/ murein hydrolase activator NlpD|tara:strand:- start:2315 stop:2881 length:567 start_codon:yes stop_codon:yes gene_type:complete